MLNGASTVFGAEVKYYTVIQTTLPAASMGEIFFQRFYNSLVKRKGDPEFTTFLFGFENMTVRAEMSLFDIAIWIKENPSLADYTLRTATESLVTDFKAETPPEGIPTDLWAEYRSRFKAHFEEFGRTAYEFDFANPTPAEEPSPQFEAVKLFIEGKATSPYDRLQTAADNREQATRSVLKRIGWPRKGWFEKRLKKAHETGTIREDSIFDMGMGHPVIRRMLNELGRRFVEKDVIEAANDIYWLEQREVEEVIQLLEYRQPLPDFSDRVPGTQSGMAGRIKDRPADHAAGKILLAKVPGRRRAGRKGRQGQCSKAWAPASGQVTAPACVLSARKISPR